MATASIGQTSSTSAEQNRCHLFRLQMLIIDGGLLILRNILDKKLQNSSLSLSTFLQQKRLKLTNLRSKGRITQVQYDLLFPSGGSGPSTNDLDVTLIMFLLRNFKSFGLNKNFQWNSNPAQVDTSIEADIFRLTMYRNELSHISSTSGITPNVFTKKWTEIEQVLLRLNSKTTSIQHLQNTIDDFKVSPLDPEAEGRVQKAIDSWQMLEKSVKAELKLIKEDTKDIKHSVDSQAQSIDELNRKTFEHDKQIRELKLKEEPKKDDTAETESLRLSQYAEWKKKLKDQLITWYNANQSTVPLSPLTDDSHTPLAGFYILPEIDIQTNLSGGKKVTTRVKSLLDLFASDRKRQLKIYLSAIAGFGKTAFSKYLTITWCQAHKKDESYKHFKEKELDALSDFKFLFLVLLRDSVNVCDVDDMIKQQVIQYLPCSSSMPKGLLKDILDHEKCLVILDGLDEWSHPDNKCTKLPKSIPHQYEREKCVILTTTRPWKLGVSNLKTNQIHKTIELVQLKKDDVRQFSHNAMEILKGNTEEDELCIFEEKIRNHGLEDMESTPLLLLYLICLWVYKFPIGSSAVAIYTGIIELLLSRTATLHGQFHSSCEISPSYIPECFENHTRCSCYSTFLLKIGKLAFYTLFSKIKEHTLVFDKNIAEKYLNQEDLKSSCLAGMLSESKTKTLIAESSKISFSHKTVQEYFSAIFISFQNTTEVQNIIFEECNCLQNILNMSKVFVFISNMNPKLMSAISRDLMPMINNDEKTGKYRTNTDINHMPVLQDIQDMYISCAIETKENINLKLYLQDFRISDNAQCQELQHLCQQNKENIKSIMIRNVDIYSLQEIIKLFALSDFPLIEKFYYKGEIKEEEEDEITSLLFNTLKCFTMRSCKYKNHAFHAKYCRLSAEINDRLENLQHLEYLCLTYFTMTHEIMERLLIFLTSKKSMKEIILYELKCSDHDTDDISCRFSLDLSQHLHLRYLGLTRIPVSKINMDASLLEQCTVGELHQPGDASSFLSRLPAASKLHTLMCQHIKSSCDIETMLKTLPLLHYMKEFWLYGINLGEKSLKLSPKMSNIELVALYYITMSCTVLNDLITVDLITVINKLPHTVTVCLEGCDIKPETEFENFKTLIKNSDIFVITHDGTLKSGTYRFEFKTIETT